MEAIYEYQLVDTLRIIATGGVTDYFPIPMPQGARFCSLGVQNGVPVVWMRVDPNAPLEHRGWRIATTGAELPNACSHDRYRGRFELGPYVYHVFEL